MTELGDHLSLTAVAEVLRALTVADDATGRQVYDAVEVLIALRNLVDHQLAVHVASLDRLGVAKAHGRCTRELLIVMGLAPVVAQRLLRIAAVQDSAGAVMGHAADGAISAEHVDAIVRGVRHVDQRIPQTLDAEARKGVVNDLLAQHFSGATPAEIADRAHTLGNELAADSDDGLPAAENRAINTLTLTRQEGRVQIRGDLDTVVGEKLWTAVDAHATPRPQPDGSRDPRSPDRRRADALETILDLAATGGSGGVMVAGAPRTQIALTLPADTPALSSLQFLGSVTESTAKKLGCDASITVMIVDGEQVPLAVGREKRLFTASQRKALVCRDKGCIKCGAPASWTQAHHIVHWADGGDTDVDNGCLLCPSCHDDIHHGGWEIVMGFDHHPWLRPPAAVDPRRDLIPAYRRRRMHIADLPAAA